MVHLVANGNCLTVATERGTVSTPAHSRRGDGAGEARRFLQRARSGLTRRAPARPRRTSSEAKRPLGVLEQLGA
eukprot:scaffold7583_cov118-Isochrysis_galbana.AAC.13